MEISKSHGSGRITEKPSLTTVFTPTNLGILKILKIMLKLNKLKVKFLKMP